ncbi:GyrI-like domain-containing protein [Xylanimonas sp. McL0601]|uniref:GyrI-like domain-containing protein n=1 Tax=Xylanimonas sp. McL0601 TaxID=3414739 RepID=UPI003CE9DE4A
MADKIDFTKTLDSYHAKRGEFRILHVPPLQYLMIDGHGDPNTSPAYTAALEALYPVAYKLKFASKHERGRDYAVPPLEGLWWSADMEVFTASRDKSQWDWTMMLMVPDWTDDPALAAAVEQAGAKNPPARLGDVRLQPLAEERCVQTLHVGSFDDEGPVLQRMHDEFIPGHGLRMDGMHHEIYFSDVRRVAPETCSSMTSSASSCPGHDRAEEPAGSRLRHLLQRLRRRPGVRAQRVARP